MGDYWSACANLDYIQAKCELPCSSRGPVICYGLPNPIYSQSAQRYPIRSRAKSFARNLYFFFLHSFFLFFFSLLLFITVYFFFPLVSLLTLIPLPNVVHSLSLPILSLYFLFFFLLIHNTCHLNLISFIHDGHLYS